MCFLKTLARTGDSCDAVLDVYCLKVKAVYSPLWEPIAELRSVTCHMGSHSVICTGHRCTSPTLTPTKQAVLDLRTPEGWKAELTLVLIVHNTEMVYLFAGSHAFKL